MVQRTLPGMLYVQNAVYWPPYSLFDTGIGRFCWLNSMVDHLKDNEAIKASKQISVHYCGRNRLDSKVQEDKYSTKTVPIGPI